METIKFQGKMFAVVDKKVMINELGRHAPGTPLIIEEDADTLVLTKEYRPELNTYDIRLPGGKVCDSLGEYLALLEENVDLAPKIEAAARKEALEEAGITNGEFSLIHTSVAGLTVEWDLHYFLVKDIKVGAQELEEHEDIEVVRVKKDEAKAMCLDGRISEERSALILLKYLSS